MKLEKLRVKAVCLLLAVILPAVQICSVSAAEQGRAYVESAAKIYVNGLAGSDFNDGASADSAYQTLGKAIGSAKDLPAQDIRIIVAGKTTVTEALAISGRPLTITSQEQSPLSFSKGLAIDTDITFENIALDFSETIELKSGKLIFSDAVTTEGRPDILCSSPDLNPLDIGSGTFGSVIDSSSQGRLTLRGGTISQIKGWNEVLVSPLNGHPIVVQESISDVATLKLRAKCDSFTVNGNIEVDHFTCTGEATINLLSGKKIKTQTFSSSIIFNILPINGSVAAGEYLTSRVIPSILLKGPKEYEFVIQNMGSYFSATLRKKVNVDSVSINHSSYTLNRGGKLSLKAYLKPNEAHNTYFVLWDSSNPSAASVDNYGTVTAKQPGSAVITATSTDISRKTASCRITVRQKPYTITYRLNGGINHRQNPAEFISPPFALKAPSRRGYSFEGWYVDSSFRTRIKSIDAKKNYTLYAKWKKIVIPAPEITSMQNPLASRLTVHYSKANSVSGYEIAVSTKSSFTLSSTKKITAKGTTKTVKGLKNGAAYYVRVRAYKYDSTGAKVFGPYSSKQKGYAVRYVLKGGKNNSANPIRYYQASLRLKSPTRKGYIFKGWYTNKKCTKRIRSISKNKRINYTLYAKWKKKG